jgi:hypothetical protein
VSAADDVIRQALKGVLPVLAAPLLETTLAYRQQIIDAGLSPEAADRMAADFHHLLVQNRPTAP